jgi:hypothetical protein
MAMGIGHWNERNFGHVLDDDKSVIPKQSPSWFTWMWLLFAAVVIVLTVIGFAVAGP